MKKKAAVDEEKKLVESVNAEVPKNLRESIFKEISTSQWGGIRKVASSSETAQDMWDFFFAEENGEKVGMLNSGVAYDRYWSKVVDNFQDIIKDKSCKFVAKFASEMAKRKQQLDKQQNENK